MAANAARAVDAEFTASTETALMADANVAAGIKENFAMNVSEKVTYYASQCHFPKRED
jgi:hypothetical protein